MPSIFLTMSRKIAYYVRVSTEDKQDYQHQIDALDKCLKDMGVTVDNNSLDIYSEKKSGYKDDRQELQKLLNKIQEDNEYYSCVYVTEISRIGRNTKKVRETLEIFKECKVNLYIKQLKVNLLNDDSSINSYGNLLLSIFIELSDAEARTAKERFKDGILSGIKAGKAGGGKLIPYGFMKGENKMLVINETEADTVRLIFDLYKSGNGTKAIANYLNNLDIKTRSGLSFAESIINAKTGKTGKEVKWQDKTVDDILQNPIYIGKRRYWGGKQNRKKPPMLFDMVGKPILSPITIFDECMEIRNSKTHKNFLTTYVYLLKDKMICGKCGRNYFAKYKPTPHGDKVYICSSRLKKNGNCGNGGINISLIESAIFNEIVNSDSILRYINDNSKIKASLTAEIIKLRNNIETCSRNESELERDIDSLIELQLKAMRNGESEMRNRYEKRLEEKTKEFDNNKNQLAKAKRHLIKTEIALNKNSNIETTATQLKEYINDRTQLRSIYLQLIDKIIINVIDENTALADTFISIDGIVLPNSLKIFLDLAGIRKKEKSYRYIATANFGIELEYKENVLLTDSAKLAETIHLINENAGLIEETDKISIPHNYVLTIPLEKL